MARPKRIALFGGSFDPIHLGHLQIAATARRELDLDLVLFIPCRQSPHKENATQASEEQRVEMIRLALEDCPWAEVCEVELLLPPPSYSWVTAEALREIYPDGELFWLMGADQWAVIPSWTRPDHLATLVEFVVHARGEPPPAQPGFQAHFIEGEHPASATAIREAAPESLPSGWLPGNVERFIKSEGLYRCGS